MIKHILFLALATTACLQSIAQENINPTVQEQPAKAAAVELAVIKAPEPSEYTLENRMAVGGLIHFFRNKSLASNLSMDMVRFKPRLADLLNNEIAVQLSAKGIQSPEVVSTRINLEKPWKLDYSALSKHGKPILFIYVESLGVKSQIREDTYKPFAYVVFCLITPKRSNDCTEFGRAAFGDGIDQDDEESWYVGNLREEQWRNADEVYTNLPELTQSYRRAMPRMVGWLTNAALAYLDSEEYKKLIPK